MEKIIRIGTRDSKLALWQAQTVQTLLEQQGYRTSLVSVKSEGDLDLVTPLYAMGVQGVFTKTLDAYLLSQKIDIAVHSLKDVPTQWAQGLCPVAVLERADVHDLCIPHPNPNKAITNTIATGSVRRKAQWLHRYPNTKIENLRGNLQTRLQKLEDSTWDAAIFAAAGLDRLAIRPSNAEVLDWMLPAPAQGAVVVAARIEDHFIKEACQQLNHFETAICVEQERMFLKTLMGGCSTPISALASIHKERFFFRANILMPDGSQKMEIEKEVAIDQAATLGEHLALELLAQGAHNIVTAIRNFV